MEEHIGEQEGKESLGPTDRQTAMQLTVRDDKPNNNRV